MGREEGVFRSEEEGVASGGRNEAEHEAWKDVQMREGGIGEVDYVTKGGSIE